MCLRGKKKAPGVLCLHGTDNIVGHGIVVGLGGEGEPPVRQRARRARLRHARAELPAAGEVPAGPQEARLGERHAQGRLGQHARPRPAGVAAVRGRSGGFGTIGHSLGGHNSVYTAVFDDRLKVVVSSCGLDSFLDYYGGDEKNWEPEKGWCQTRYMPKLADYKGRLADIPFDFHELIGALAPRVRASSSRR